MALQPWAIDGAKLSAAQARAMAFKQSGGARGVTLPGDLRVTALPTPGGAVRVAPGGATIPNDYPGGQGQSYGTLMVASEDVNVPATGSGGGATRYLIQRIIDPEFGGQTPPDPLTYRYDPFVLVSSITNLNYPYVPLAKIVQPANTATITQGMITDLREIANPKSKRRVYPVRINAAGVEELSGVNGEYWPNAGGVQNIAVPEWATHMNVVCTWAQVFIPASSNPFGTLTLRFGPWDGAKNKYETTWVSFDALAGTNAQRTSFILPANRGVPADIRGTTQPFVLFGVNSSSSPAGKRAKLDTGSAVYMDIEFLQVPELIAS